MLRVLIAKTLNFIWHKQLHGFIFTGWLHPSCKCIICATIKEDGDQCSRVFLKYVADFSVIIFDQVCFGQKLCFERGLYERFMLIYTMKNSENSRYNYQR